MGHDRYPFHQGGFLVSGDGYTLSPRSGFLIRAGREGKWVEVCRSLDHRGNATGEIDRQLCGGWWERGGGGRGGAEEVLMGSAPTPILQNVKEG